MPSFKDFLRPKKQAAKAVIYEVEDSWNSDYRSARIVLNSPKTGARLSLYFSEMSNIPASDKEFISEIVQRINLTKSLREPIKQLPLTREEVLVFMKYAHKTSLLEDLTNLSKEIPNYIRSTVAAEVRKNFDDDAVLDVTRVVMKEDTLSIQVNVRGPWKIEVSDMDAAWGKVAEVLRDALSQVPGFPRHISVKMLQRGPSQALYGIEIQ